MIARAELDRIRRRCMRTFFLWLSLGVVLVFVWQAGVWLLLDLFPNLRDNFAIMMPLLAGQILPFFWMAALGSRAESRIAVDVPNCASCGFQMRSHREMARALRTSRCPGCGKAIIAGEAPHSAAAIARWRGIADARHSRRSLLVIAAATLLLVGAVAVVLLVVLRSTPFQ